MTIYRESQCQRCSRVSLEVDKSLHLTLSWVCVHLSMLGFKLIHVSKMDPVGILCHIIQVCM